ncbi:MAG: response regulator transcription factor [Synechococcales bacterium]|nr:response regulator transcription factor [Synechococcales bacterium]
MLLQPASLQPALPLFPTPDPATSPISLLSQDEVLLKKLETSLRHEGYLVHIVPQSWQEAMAHLLDGPSFTVLDWSLFGSLSLEYCRRSRQTQPDIPLLLLTETGAVGDRIAGLNAGADDCLEKPFCSEEFIAKIRAHLRRTQVYSPDELVFEDLRLNRKTREVYRGNQSILLTAKEFDLLEYLLLNCRQVMTRDQILEHVWGYDFAGESNVIEVYIRYLRLKLETYNQRRLIHTVRYVGYVLREAS